jgi:hypothetical protein
MSFSKTVEKLLIITDKLSEEETHELVIVLERHR